MSILILIALGAAAVWLQRRVDAAKSSPPLPKGTLVDRNGRPI